MDAGEADVLVFGAGMGGLCASLFAAKRGLKVILCEKASQLGGTTATSAGMVWIPGSSEARVAGIQDSREQVRQYLMAELGPYAQEDMVDAFIADAPAALAELQRDTEVAFTLSASPDYHPDNVGGVERGRALVAVPFDGRRLGEAFGLVRPPNEHLLVLGGMMVAYNEVASFLAPWRSLEAFTTVLRRVGRYVLDRRHHLRGTELSHGNALVAMLLASLLARGAEI